MRRESRHHYWRAGRCLEGRGVESGAGAGVRSGRYRRDDLQAIRSDRLVEELRGESQGVGEQIGPRYHLCRSEDEKQKVLFFF